MMKLVENPKHSSKDMPCILMSCCLIGDVVAEIYRREIMIVTKEKTYMGMADAPPFLWSKNASSFYLSQTWQP
jgi:hypothetical protein